MLLATVWTVCTKRPLELLDLGSVEICVRTQKYISCDDRIFSHEYNGRQSIVLQ